jgi:hypothetical protein
MRPAPVFLEAAITCYRGCSQRAQLRVVAPGVARTYTGLPDDLVEGPPTDLAEES